MSYGFHPTGLFLANHSIFGAFEPPDLGAYLDAVKPHFRPSAVPRVQVYVASFDEVSPWPLTPYLEASVFVSVRHGIMEGWFPLTMPLTKRVPMIGGRLRGFPKKMADVALTETDDGWVGVAQRKGRMLLRLAISGLNAADDGERDPRTHHYGTPILNLRPPLRGPQVVATTIETLTPATATRLEGEMTISADPDLPWAKLLPSTTTGYFETTQGAVVLRHGRVAAKYEVAGGAQPAMG
jgi:hypothetical protein